MFKQRQTKFVPGIESELLHCFNEASDLFLASKGDIGRIKSLRPSQLPFCSTNFFCYHAVHGAIRSMDMRGSFYTSIGTSVHEVLQTYMAPSGKFLATWKCRQCGTIHKVSMQNECCDFQMDYHEIEINYKGVVGHIDAVFKDRNGDYWIVDFKTTSVESAAKKLKEPGLAYVEQIETYALMLWLQYGIKVRGVILMFIKRNKPTDPIIWKKELTDEDFKRIKARTVKYKKQHKEVLNVSTLEQALALARHGRCENKWCKTCKSPTSLTKQIKEAFKRGSHRLPLIGLK